MPPFLLDFFGFFFFINDMWYSDLHRVISESD